MIYSGRACRDKAKLGMLFEKLRRDSQVDENRKAFCFGRNVFEFREETDSMTLKMLLKESFGLALRFGKADDHLIRGCFKDSSRRANRCSNHVRSEERR